MPIIKTLVLQPHLGYATVGQILPGGQTIMLGAGILTETANETKNRKKTLEMLKVKRFKTKTKSLENR